MSTITTHDHGAAEKRAAMEQIIVHYPNIGEHELGLVLRYLRKEASALDAATIASSEHLTSQYRQLCSDHYLNRMTPLQAALAAVAVGVAVLLVAIWLIAFA